MSNTKDTQTEAFIASFSRSSFFTHRPSGKRTVDGMLVAWNRRGGYGDEMWFALIALFMLVLGVLGHVIADTPERVAQAARMEVIEALIVVGFSLAASVPFLRVRSLLLDSSRKLLVFRYGYGPFTRVVSCDAEDCDLTMGAITNGVRQGHSALSLDIPGQETLRLLTLPRRDQVAEVHHLLLEYWPAPIDSADATVVAAPQIITAGTGKSVALPRTPIFVQGYRGPRLSAKVQQKDQTIIIRHGSAMMLSGCLAGVLLVLVTMLAFMIHMPFTVAAGFFLVINIPTLLIGLTMGQGDIRLDAHEGVKLPRKVLTEGTIGRVIPTAQVAAIQLCSRFEQGGHVQGVQLPSSVQMQVIVVTNEGGRALLLTGAHVSEIEPAARDIAKLFSVPVIDHREL